MTVGLLTVASSVPGARSLKDQRTVVQRIEDQLKKINVAVSEIERLICGSAPVRPWQPS
jgi:uncharacterized protein YlxP (DUF503 family)